VLVTVKTVAAARPNIDSGADAWAAAIGRVFDVHEPFRRPNYTAESPLAGESPPSAVPAADALPAHGF
jgi:hypothetical protein